MSDAIAGAIVGGLIGFISGLAVAALSILWTYRHDQYRRALVTHREYLSWLRGLVPECELIVSSIDELQPTYNGMLTSGDLRCPTRRLNSDFLAAARLGVMKHPRGSRLFAPLTRAYRDVVHTNEMMSRFETRYREVTGSANRWQEMQGILRPTAECMPGARASVEALLAAAREQEDLESQRPPTVWEPD
jgi:hypothetical protein